jgi:hypothetical protein
MKAAKALDVSGDGQIDKSEFERLMHEEVIAAAELQVSLGAKVAALWKAMPLGEKCDDPRQVNRLACWAILQKDDELAVLIVKNDLAQGKKLVCVCVFLKCPLKGRFCKDLHARIRLRESGMCVFCAASFFWCSVLEAMKGARALDVSGDGQIDAEEFKRLMNTDVIAAAEAKAAAA